MECESKVATTSNCRIREGVIVHHDGRTIKKIGEATAPGNYSKRSGATSE